MYRQITGENQTEIVINKSRFISTCAYVENEEDAKAFVEKIRKKYSDATHNCYAYIFDELGNALKFSDDGEPQGTAGMPILEVIRNKALVKTAVVVTRYFGGIKLGAGGLVRAYTEAAAKALSQAKICVMTEAIYFDFFIDYNLYKLSSLKLMNLSGVEILNAEFFDKVKISLVVKQDCFEEVSKELVELTNGACVLEKKERKFYPFKE